MAYLFNIWFGCLSKTNKIFYFLLEIENKIKLNKHCRKHVAQTVMDQQQQQLVTKMQLKKQRTMQTKKKNFNSKCISLKFLVLRGL